MAILRKTIPNKLHAINVDIIFYIYLSTWKLWGTYFQLASHPWPTAAIL